MSERSIPCGLSTVLFDLDDTLADSFDARVSALGKVFFEEGIGPPTAAEFLVGLHGRQLKEALAQIEADMGMKLDLFERYRQTYWTKEPGQIRLYPDIGTCLKRLRSRGVRLGIVTQKVREFEVDGHRTGAMEELRELGVSDMFSVVVGFEDVTYHKPHPEAVHVALSRLGAAPEETLMVGDSRADIEAARRAGCWSCHAIWGISADQAGLGDEQADLVAKTPDILLGLDYLPTLLQ